ncbi:MAG: hypothetical protein OQL09_09325 [Gammaproteobacteria bacterium]|nr:hypothetical protein [Gammaproteobacteria bacterium]
MQINQLESAEHASTANAQSHNGTRAASIHFDDRMDKLLNIAEKLILSKGVFHLTLHFSSSQLSCCTFDNPYSFQLYTADEVFSDNFMRHFAPLESKLRTSIERNQVRPILNALKWLRSKQHGSELRNASLHMINGYIGLSFACDDTRYINFRELILPTMPVNA